MYLKTVDADQLIKASAHITSCVMKKLFAEKKAPMQKSLIKNIITRIIYR